MMNKSGITDLIPEDLRQQWIADGSYPDRNIFDVFYEKASKNPDNAAVLMLEETITFGELLDASLRLANSLKGLGIVEGDVVAYQLPNSWYCCAIDFAVAALGAVVVPFPPGRGSLDIASLLRRCDARMFIGVASFGETDICEVIESLRTTLLSLRFMVIEGANRTHWLNLQALMQASPITLAELPKVSPQAPVRFLVSSGTESEPKLVAYSHNSLLGGRGRFLQRLQAGGETFRGLYLVPLGSAFGSTASSAVLAFLGGSLVLLPKFDVQLAVKAIAQFQPTHLLGVPTMFQRIAMEKQLTTINKSGLQAIISGGAVADETTIKRCQQAFGCHFINLYGSADGVNCHNMPADHPDSILRTVGKPNRSVCVIKIVDDNGDELTQGGVGEILARGPISPMQYVNAPALDKTYRDEEGWVHTGDLGYIDKQGYLVLSGRKKDIIIRGGVNISPVQIEKLVTGHTDVIGATCIAVSDSSLGHRVGICLMLRAGAERLSLAELSDFLSEQGLERNKIPEYLRFYKNLPLNPAGKIDKRKLTRDFDFLATTVVCSDTLSGVNSADYLQDSTKSTRIQAS